MNLRIAARAGFPGAIALALVSGAIVAGDAIPAPLVPLSRVPDFIGTCDDVDQAMLEHRFDHFLDGTPSGWVSRWLPGDIVSTPSCMAGGFPHHAALVFVEPDELHLVTEGARELATPRRLPGMEPVICAGQIHDQFVDLDGDGIVEFVQVRYLKRSTVRVIRVRNDQIEISRAHELTDREWEPTARRILTHDPFGATK